MSFAVLVTRHHLCLNGVSSCGTVCFLQGLYIDILYFTFLVFGSLITYCEDLDGINQSWPLQAMALYDSPGDEEREKALESGSAEKTGLPPRSHTRPYSSKLDHGIQTGWSSPPPGDFKPPQRTNTGSFSIDSMFKQFPETDFSRFTEWVERLAIRIIYPEMFVVGIFLVSIYSTILSTVWLLIAIIRPHWGSFVAMNGGSLSPRLASVLVAGFAKTIEMSFSTVMIACVGQYLTNKAKQSGISLIDLQVKSMILLPMALVTQKGGVRALLRSGVLGFICILAYTGSMMTTPLMLLLLTSLAAALYTTASDAVGMCKELQDLFDAKNSSFTTNWCITSHHNEPISIHSNICRQYLSYRTKLSESSKLSTE